MLEFTIAYSFWLVLSWLQRQIKSTQMDFQRGFAAASSKRYFSFLGKTVLFVVFYFHFVELIVLHMGFGLKGFCPFGDSCKYLHPKNNPAQNTGNQGLRGIFLPLHLIVCCWCRWYLCSSSLMYYFSRHFLELFFAMHFSYQLLDLRILMLGHHRLIKGFI